MDPQTLVRFVAGGVLDCAPLARPGVAVGGEITKMMADRISLGTILGLCLGKPHVDGADAGLLDAATLGILVGSLISGLAGAVVLARAGPSRRGEARP